MLGPCGSADLVSNQTSCGLFVGNAEKRFGEAHEDDTLCGAEPVLVKKDVEPTHRAPLSPDMLDEPSRTPIDSLGHRGHEPGIRKQCADTRRFIGTIEFADSRP